MIYFTISTGDMQMILFQRKWKSGKAVLISSEVIQFIVTRER